MAPIGTQDTEEMQNDMCIPGPEVSGEQPISHSPTHEDQAKIKGTIELTLTGQLTEAVLVPVLADYQDILGRWVWFCPQGMAEEKGPAEMTFSPEELVVIIPLLIENRELASTLVSAKRIFGGTIMDSSLLDLPTAKPYGSQAGLGDFQSPEGSETLDLAVSQSLYQNSSNNQDTGGIPSLRGGLPSPGRHLVIIKTVKAYLHNFPDYTVPRARLEMKILEGPDSGKIIMDNVSLPHPLESKGMLHRRVRIAYRLGLIPWGTKGIIQVDWKLLEGVVCWVDVAYKSLGGRKVITVEGYELH